MQKKDAPNAAARKAGLAKWIKKRTTPEAIAERFWKQVEKKGPDECWEWNGESIPYRGFIPVSGAPKSGPGRFYFGQVRILAHRFSWELINGPIPKGMCVCHKCDNPPCVNPGHLFVATQSENMRDSISKGRFRFLRGGANGHAKLNDSVVSQMRSEYRPHTMSFAMLARRFGVSKRCVMFIVHRQTWKHVP